MSRTRTGAVLVTALLVFPALAAPSPASIAPPGAGGLVARVHEVGLRQRAEERATWVGDELLVVFDERVDRRARERIVRSRGASVERHLGLFGVSVVDLPPGQGVARAMQVYGRDPRVVHVEPNRLVFVGQVPPDDPRYVHQWGLNNTGQAHTIADPPPPAAAGKTDADIDAPAAWATELGKPTSVVAVLDSGVDVNHPDLAANIWTNRDEIAGNGRDDDRNGHVDDVHGWDFAEDDRTLLESRSRIAGREHGTLVAGTVAAEMNNSTGVVGTCPGCRVMVLKFMRPRDTDGDLSPDTMVGSTKDELEALTYAIREGADILNASFSTFVWSHVERRAFRTLGRAGILSVAAAGNSNLDNDMLLSFECGSGSYCFSPEYPASFDLPRILSVAATNHRDQYGYFTGCDAAFPRWQCSFTSWGHESVDVAAPGVDIMTTRPGGYETVNGTSFAAPHVSGLAGLVKSRHPTYGPMQIKNAIMRSVETPPSLRRLWAFPGEPATGRFTQTSGRVDARAALTASTRPATPLTDGNVAGARRIRSLKNGRVAWPGDVNDVYRRRLRRGRRYKIVLDGPRTKDFDLLVWKPKTKEIWQYEVGCLPGQKGPCKLARYAQKLDANKADEVVRLRAKKTGKYYMHVSAWPRNGGAYTLKVRRIR